MGDRLAPKVDKFTLVAGAWTQVYVPPGAPVDEPVSILNMGGDVVEIRTSTSNALIPLAAGDFIVLNSSHSISARTQTAEAELLSAFGVRFGSSRATESGGASSAEVELIALGNTSKQLLTRILLELQISNAYNASAHDEEITSRDLSNGDLRMMVNPHLTK